MLIFIKRVSIILGFAVLLSVNAHAVNTPSVSAASAVLIDGDTAEILYEKSAYEQRSMASTTKIMTTLIAVESGRMSDVVTVNEKIYVEGTAIGFEKGDKLTLKDLCFAALLESGNDAAVLIAEFLSGSEEKFSILMNKKADEIGMSGTNFVTASGLDDEQHYTTAYDMAILGAYAVKNDDFREICSSKIYTAKYIDSSKVRYFSNHNRLLSSVEGVFGIKTGFTKKSGRCLVSVCERNEKTLVAVTLNAPDDWNDHEKLYQYGYSLYENYELNVNDTLQSVNVVGSDNKSIDISINGNESASMLKGADITYRTKLRSFYYAPINTGDIIGEIEFYQNSKLICTRLITAAEKAEVSCEIKPVRENVFKKIISYISRKGR